MKRLTSFLSLALCLFTTGSFASPVAYPFRVTDNSGALVAGATVAVGSTTLTAGSVTSVPTTAGEKVLGTAAPPGAAASVTLLDFGTGDYALVYDPAGGEMYFPLTVSKSGSTITNSNALVPVVCAADSSVVLGTNTKIGTPAGASVSADIAAVPGLTLTAFNADSLYSKLVHHQDGKFTYNPSTKVLTLLLDDGATTLAAPTLTVDGSGNITSRL